MSPINYILFLGLLYLLCSRSLLGLSSDNYCSYEFGNKRLCAILRHRLYTFVQGLSKTTELYYIVTY
jgi:hypothetical protein